MLGNLPFGLGSVRGEVGCGWRDEMAGMLRLIAVVGD
jgi:hypothetical protein